MRKDFLKKKAYRCTGGMTERRNKKVNLGLVKSETDKRDVIHSDAQKLLVIQREGNFTFRLVDVLHSPKTFFKGMMIPWVMHGQNAKELGMSAGRNHTLLCLLSPLLVGSCLSVGKSKIVYRTKNTIPGLSSDDYCTGCACPCCLIIQLRNELDEQKREEAKMNEITKEILAAGQEIVRS
ncbi:unnamed protein product [Clavelina lepadiformis]|uniref:Uncharacterized protein n=1 Tax=Clavelina lepadiformis TaxID=159417 RepID=A0ABP0GKP4_CLALP